MEKRIECKTKQEAIQAFAGILDKHTTDKRDVINVIGAIMAMREFIANIKTNRYDELNFWIRSMREKINVPSVSEESLRTFDNMSDALVQGIVINAQYPEGIEILEGCEEELEWVE